MVKEPLQNLLLWQPIFGPVHCPDGSWMFFPSFSKISKNWHILLLCKYTVVLLVVNYNDSLDIEKKISFVFFIALLPGPMPYINYYFDYNDEFGFHLLLHHKTQWIFQQLIFFGQRYFATIEVKLIFCASILDIFSWINLWNGSKMTYYRLLYFVSYCIPYMYKA